MGTTNDDGERFFQSAIYEADRRTRRAPTGRSILEPARDIPVHTTCDVLVVGAARPAPPQRCGGAARSDVVLLVSATPSGRVVDRRTGHLDRPHE
jgi:hypothetical protein